MIKKTYINALIFFLIARSDFFWCIHITAPYKNLLSLIFYQTFLSTTLLLDGPLKFSIF